MSSTTVHLGDRIRDARGTMTQDELAERIRSKRPKLKVSGVRISRYERGVQQPRFSLIVAIAEETGKPLEFFRVDEDGGDGGESGSGDDEDDEDAEAMTRAAYLLDRSGDYALADDLRRRARRSRFKTQSRGRV